MKDKLVNLKVAKLAKEKKFSWGCNNTFDEVYGDNSGKLVPSYDINEYCNKYGKTDTYITRPTQSLLQKWLREKHNIHMYVIPNEDYTKYKVYVYQNSYRTVEYKYYNTYEQALEKGLEQGLKLIN